MKRDYKLFLNDIQESITLIEEYSEGISEEQFLKDVSIQDKIIRRIEIIGEASSNIPRAFKEKNKNIPWLDISQFRNFIVHHYFEASKNRIWKLIKEDIPRIKQEMQNIKLV